MEIHKKIKTSIKDALMIEQSTAKAEQNEAKLDYIAMMCGIDMEDGSDDEVQ